MDQTYPMSISDDALHDLLERIDKIHGLAEKLNYNDVTPNHL